LTAAERAAARAGGATGTSLAPIGVFDSGVGGLTVLKALIAALPNEQFIYLGDTARLPYGTKSPETVARYSIQAAEALAEYGVKCLVVACNTASAVGLPGIRNHIENVPVIGVVEPGAEAACATSPSGRIAVIATEGTVRGAAYQEAIIQRRSDARVTARPTPLFVALAEEGLCEGPIAEGIARHYLEPIFTPALRAAASVPPAGPSATAGGAGEPANTRASGTTPDTLVLGCTHFPMLAGTIRAVVGPSVRIVDSADTTAQAVRATIERGGGRSAGTGVPKSSEPARVRFLATDSIERFVRVGSLFLGRPIAPHEVELIDL
jgi:glutamate racemase